MRFSNPHESIVVSPPEMKNADCQTEPGVFSSRSIWLQVMHFANKADELEVAFEQLVNEIDHNCEHSQSAQEPHGFPEESNDYD